MGLLLRPYEFQKIDPKWSRSGTVFLKRKWEIRNKAWSPSASAQWAGCNWRSKPTRPGHQFASETPHFFKEKVCIGNRRSILGWWFQTIFKSYCICHSFWCFFDPPWRKTQFHHLVTAHGHQPTMCTFTAYNLRRWCSSRPQIINAERVGDLLHHALASGFLSQKKVRSRNHHRSSSTIY